MRRLTLCDFQYIHLKLRHYRCYHDVEKKATEIRNKSISAQIYRRDAEFAEKNPEERLEEGKIGGHLSKEIYKRIFRYRARTASPVKTDHHLPKTR